MAKNYTNHFANILEQVLSKLSASWLLGTQSYCTTIFANEIRSGDTPPRNHRIKSWSWVRYYVDYMSFDRLLHMTQQPKDTCQRTWRQPKTDNLENLYQKLDFRWFEILVTYDGIVCYDLDGEEVVAAISASPVPSEAPIQC